MLLFWIISLQTLHVLRGSMDGLVHHNIYKGGFNQKIQHVLRGSMINVYIQLFSYGSLLLVNHFPLISKGENILVYPLPLMSKGESILVFLVISNSFYRLQ